MDSTVLLNVYSHPIPNLLYILTGKHDFGEDSRELSPLLAQPAMAAVLQDRTAAFLRDQDTDHAAASSSRPEKTDHASPYAQYKAAISTNLTCRGFVHDLAMLNDCLRTQVILSGVSTAYHQADGHTLALAQQVKQLLVSIVWQLVLSAIVC